MKIRSALVVLLTTVGLASASVSAATPASAASWHEGWCKKGEGLSVVVDFYGSDSPAVPDDGWIVRCLVGGALDNPGNTARWKVFESVGLPVEVVDGSYVTSIAGVEQDASSSTYWMMSGAGPGATAWNTDLWSLAGSSFTGWSYGASLTPRNTPRLAPQYTAGGSSGATPALSAKAPTVAGTRRVGKTLAVRTGGWSAGSSLRYQWLRNGHAIRGATKARYTLKRADAKKRLRVRVTGTKSGYRATTRTSAIARIKYGTLAGPKPRATGTAKTGKTLKAKPGAWRPRGVKVRYQWFRGSKKISKATKARYRLKTADRGKRVRVQVTITKPGYVKKVRKSKARKVR